MTKDDTSPCVFPRQSDEIAYSQPGITLRDLAALVAFHEWIKPYTTSDGVVVVRQPESVANFAYLYADALMKAREA